MKKIIICIAILCAFVQSMQSSSAYGETSEWNENEVSDSQVSEPKERIAYEIQGSTQTKRLPIGTKLPLKMAEPVTTKDFSEGDMFSATVVNDIVLDRIVVLPAGTLVRGNVAKIVEAKRLSKCANLYLTFDHLVTPQGRQLPIKAALSSNFKLTTDGGITTGGNYGYALRQNWDSTVEIVKKSTDWGLNSGDKLKYVLTPIGAVAGTIGGGGYLVVDSVADLFRKGDQVVINQGQVFGVMLLAPLDVPAN